MTAHLVFNIGNMNFIIEMKNEYALTIRLALLCNINLIHININSNLINGNKLSQLM
jgi:hypothetical protein